MLHFCCAISTSVDHVRVIGRVGFDRFCHHYKSDTDPAYHRRSRPQTPWRRMLCWRCPLPQRSPAAASNDPLAVITPLYSLIDCVVLARCAVERSPTDTDTRRQGPGRRCGRLEESAPEEYDAAARSLPETSAPEAGAMLDGSQHHQRRLLHGISRTHLRTLYRCRQSAYSSSFPLASLVIWSRR